MVDQIDPLEAIKTITSDYIRYLQTIYPFQDSNLKEQFSESLSSPGFLVKGPILEASAPFKKGRSIKQLVKDGILDANILRLDSDALPLDRLLYLHQDQAIDKIVRQSAMLL